MVAAVAVGLGGSMAYIASSMKQKNTSGEYKFDGYYEQREDKKGRKYYVRCPPCLSPHMCFCLMLLLPAADAQG